jgi:putative membrane protein
MYSRLFKLPGVRKIIVLGLLFSVFASILVSSVFAPSSGGFLYRLAMPDVFLSDLSFFFGAFVISSALSSVIFGRRKSRIMNIRRTLGVSLFSLAFTCGVFFIGWILYFGLSVPLLVDFLIFAFAAGFTIRLLVDLVIAHGHYVFSLGDSLSQPLFESLFFFALFGWAPFLSFLSLGVAVIAIFAVFTTVYVSVVGAQLKRSTGVDGRAFFSSFLTEWSAGIGEELENIIDKNAITRDLGITVFSFRNRKGRMKCILVIPSIHPGPFSGVGSSNLPAYLMRRLEKDFDCPVICAHGPSTHGENLVKSSQCQDIYDKTLDILKQCHSFVSSGPVLRLSEGGMSVACQAFGDSAVLVGTSSCLLPIDDISLEVGENAVAAAKESIKEATFVDSHSCIDPESDYVMPGSKISKLLVKLSQKVAENVSKLDKRPFMAGAAKLRSTGISRVEGMGEEGVSALIVQVSNKRNVYLLFDSNNLVVNLSDAIDKELKKAGFDDVEVLTSDTHSTSALTPGKLGYNPLGFLTPHDKIVRLVVRVTNSAVDNLEDASVCVGSRVVEGIRVAGEENMKNILTGVRNSLKIAKNLAPVSFGLAAMLSAVLLFLLSF